MGAQRDRVSVDKSDFEMFLSENQELAERHEKLLISIRELTRRCKVLEQELIRLGGIDNHHVLDGTASLADATATMRRLLHEADFRLYE